MKVPLPERQACLDCSRKDTGSLCFHRGKSVPIGVEEVLRCIGRKLSWWSCYRDCWSAHSTEAGLVDA